MIWTLARALDALRGGEVVAYPTETVWGLGVDARAPEAVDALCALKGRDAERGLSVLVPDVDGLRALAPDAPRVALELAKRHWPGPLTLVVPVVPGTLDAVATERGIGVRCSPHPTAAALVAGLGAPLVSTSCNRSGEPPCTAPAEIEAAFGAGLGIVEGPPSGGERPSTVVAVSRDGALEVLRPGPVELT